MTDKRRTQFGVTLNYATSDGTSVVEFTRADAPKGLWVSVAGVLVFLLGVESIATTRFDLVGSGANSPGFLGGWFWFLLPGGFWLVWGGLYVWIRARRTSPEPDAAG